MSDLDEMDMGHRTFAPVPEESGVNVLESKKFVHQLHRIWWAELWELKADLRMMFFAKTFMYLDSNVEVLRLTVVWVVSMLLEDGKSDSFSV